MSVSYFSGEVDFCWRTQEAHLQSVLQRFAEQVCLWLQIRQVTALSTWLCQRLHNPAMPNIPEQRHRFPQDPTHFFTLPWPDLENFHTAPTHSACRFRLERSRQLEDASMEGAGGYFALVTQVNNPSQQFQLCLLSWILPNATARFCTPVGQTLYWATFTQYEKKFPSFFNSIVYILQRHNLPVRQSRKNIAKK